MMFSSQVWAGCKQASVEEADKKKMILFSSQAVPTADYTVPPRNKTLAVIIWDWNLLSIAVLRQTEEMRPRKASRPIPEPTHPSC